MQQTRRFWIFHCAFWAVAGFLLFLSGWMQGTAFVSLVRNLYLMVAGLLLAWPLMLVLNAARSRGLPARLMFVGSACYAASLLTVLVINPVTFTMLGMPLNEMGVRVLMAGSMNYALVLALWCFLHDAVMVTGPSEQALSPDRPQTISVQKGNSKWSLDVALIDRVNAAGDYVEIHANGDCYLKRVTMAAMEQMLSGDAFIRVHRSCIVARAAVTAVEGKTKGAYLLQLRDGGQVSTGRSYQTQVKAVFL